MRSRMAKRSARTFPTRGSDAITLSPRNHHTRVLADRLEVRSSQALIGTDDLRDFELTAVERIFTRRAGQHLPAQADLEAGRRAFVDLQREPRALEVRRHHAALDAVALPGLLVALDHRLRLVRRLLLAPLLRPRRPRL